MMRTRCHTLPDTHTIEVSLDGSFPLPTNQADADRLTDLLAAITLQACAELERAFKDFS